MAKRGPKPGPVRVRGVIYKDVHECAAKLGVSTKTIYVALSQNRADSIGIGKGKHKNPVTPRKRPITLGGKTYPTLKAASEALKIPYWRLKKYSVRVRAQGKSLVADAWDGKTVSRVPATPG